MMRLQQNGFERAVEAQVTNLSLSGVFVSSDELWAVGTELVCDLPLPSENLRVRGRVVWTQPGGGSFVPCDKTLSDPTPVGMGIEFVDLSGSHIEVLSAMIDTRPVEASQLQIWFEGTEQPISAEALPSANGLQLRTALPFLREGSIVRFAAEGESQAREAVLGKTSIYNHPEDPVPRLQVELHLAPDVIMPLEIVAELRDKSTRTTLRDLEACAGTIETEQVPPSPTDGRAGVEVSTTLRGQLLELEEESYEAPEPLESSHWTFDEQVAQLADSVRGMDPVEEDVEFWQASSTGPSPWLWLAALMLLGVGVASASYTGLFSRMGDAFDAWFGSEGDTGPTRVVLPAPKMTPPAARQVVAQAPKVVPSTPKVVPSTPKVVPSTPKVVPSTPELAPTTKLAPSTTKLAVPLDKGVPKTKGYELSILNGTTSLRIPLSGSVKGHQAYPLADPDGLAIKLPRARPSLSRGLHKVGRGGVRALWLRRFEGGTQLRVLYQRPSPDCRYTVKSDAIELSCRPASR
ncbi:MAG: PilZ domain-containing protein [Deltaproteobacteria bacterium]|nr:PilZ domain-containing protein [Deltaproteobacteria bacterium]